VSVEHPPAQSPDSLRVQILATEHWSLLASRALAWNESFSRAGMYLSTISGATVALALIAQASNFGDRFRLFALAILPVVLFIGIGTVLRIGASNHYDTVCVAGMNRIRAGYLEMAPDLERFFVMGVRDDREGLLATMGMMPRRSLFAHMLSATPTLIATLNSVLVAAITTLITLQLDGPYGAAIAGAIVAFCLSLGAHLFYAQHEIKRSSELLSMRFASGD
jgi:hypothetical protein